MAADIPTPGITHPRALQRRVGKGEAAGLDDMRGRAETGGGAQHRADVPGDIGLEEGDVHPVAIARAGAGIEVDARGVMPDAAKGNCLLARPGCAAIRPAIPDRKSVVWGKSVSVRVDLGGRRIL